MNGIFGISEFRICLLLKTKNIDVHIYFYVLILWELCPYMELFCYLSFLCVALSSNGGVWGMWPCSLVLFILWQLKVPFVGWCGGYHAPVGPLHQRCVLHQPCDSHWSSRGLLGSHRPLFYDLRWRQKW